MDGYVVIGTELDTKQLEQDLKNAKKELSQFQKEEERLLKEKGKVELQLSAYDEEKAKIKANTDEMMKKAQTEEQVTNLLNMENLELNELTQKYSKQFTAIDGINDKLQDNQLQQGLINGKIDEANSKLMKAKGYENVKKQLDKINNKTSDVIKKVGKWALAIFGVRSAYMFLRQMSSTLAQYDEQYAVNLEYIRYVLAQAIAPVLQYLVSLAYKLLSYINAIAKAWFGINLFSNANVKNFNKMVGSAKSIEKSLQNAGFDEMNVLADTSNVGAGVGAKLPSLGIEEMEEPKWIDEVTAGLTGLLGIIVAIRLGLTGIKALGLGLMISGIVYGIAGLLQYLQDGSWKNFGKIIEGIGVAIIGLGLIIASLPATIAGIVVLIVGIVTKYWDKIKGFLQGGIDWLSSKVDWVREYFGVVGETIYTIIISLFQNVLNIFDSVFKALKGIFDGLIDFIVGVFTGDWSRAWEGIKKIFQSVWDGIKGIISSVWDFIKTIFTSLLNLVKSIISTIWNIVKGLINLITSGINFIIRGLNKINIKVPNWVPRCRWTKLGN